MKNAGLFLCSVAIALALAPCRSAAQPPNLNVIEVGGQRMLVLWPPETPIASVILIPGGTTHPTINGDGTIGTLGGNFLMEQRDSFLTAGFAVGIVEKPEDLRAAIAKMRTFRSPVFVIGHSNGTVPATNAATLGPGHPDGIALLSSVVVTSSPLTKNVLDYPLEHIVIPVLLVRNKHDSCPYTPPSGMDAISKRLTKASVSTVTMSSTKLVGSPCQSLAPHSYYGIEAQTVANVVNWLKAHSPAPK